MPELGEAEVRVGAPITLKPFARLPLSPVGTVTCTVRGPSAAVVVMVMLAVSCVAELKVQEFTVIPAPNAQVPPDLKLNPPITALKVLPPVPAAGVTLLMVGPVETTNEVVHPLVKPGIVTDV